LGPANDGFLFVVDLFLSSQPTLHELRIAHWLSAVDNVRRSATRWFLRHRTLGSKMKMNRIGTRVWRSYVSSALSSTRMLNGTTQSIAVRERNAAFMAFAQISE